MGLSGAEKSNELRWTTVVIPGYVNLIKKFSIVVGFVAGIIWLIVFYLIFKNLNHEGRLSDSVLAPELFLFISIFIIFVIIIFLLKRDIKMTFGGPTSYILSNDGIHIGRSNRDVFYSWRDFNNFYILDNSYKNYHRIFLSEFPMVADIGNLMMGLIFTLFRKKAQVFMNDQNTPLFIIFNLKQHKSFRVSQIRIEVPCNLEGVVVNYIKQKVLMIQQGVMR
ncbi:MAG TPA: hypothetical protein PLR18_00555 [bacterium]|nr:hypothetical protein [bacterium]